MRLWLGVLVLLYGLLLALNTTAPAIAELAGEKVTVELRGQPGGCSPMMGRPPFGGVYGSCPAQWNGSADGVLFGPSIAATAGAATAWPKEAYRYPLFSDYANIPPGNTDKVAGIVSILIITFGILVAVTERRQRKTKSTQPDNLET